MKPYLQRVSPIPKKHSHPYYTENEKKLYLLLHFFLPHYTSSTIPFRYPCATFAQGLWGSRKFVIFGESGGTIPSDRAPCGLRSRLNADKSAVNAILLPNASATLARSFFNTAILVATKKSFYSLINTCLLQRKFVCDDLLFFVSLV